MYLRDDQIELFKDVAKLTDEEIDKVKRLRKRIRKPVDSTKNVLETELTTYDEDLEETADLIQYFSLLIATKQKESNDIFLPEWKKARGVTDSINKIRLDVEAGSEDYRRLQYEVDLLKDWLKYFETLHWIFKSRIDNLRIMHGTSY